MIRIYPDKLNGTEPEVREIKSRTSMLEWFYHDGLPRSAYLDQLPISVFVDGQRIAHFSWAECFIEPGTEVEIYREPKGTDPFSITAALIFAAAVAVKALMPKIPSLSSNSRGSGKALDEASAKGNKVKTNDLIPELAGFNRRYPDYLTLTRRYFAAPREQWIEMLLCVGKGDYDIPLGKVKVGETPLLSLGDDARFAIYGPGQDMSAEPAHLVWYTAPEVSATSSGGSGLELTVTSALTIAATASAFTFADDNVTAVGGTFPTDWTDGLLLVIASPYNYTIVDGTGDDSRDIIQGDITQLGFTAGDTIQIEGDNQGNYIVHSVSATEMQLDYDTGAPAVGLKIGPVIMAVGYRGLRFRITAAGTDILAVERLKSSGATDTTWPGWSPLSSNSARVQIDSSNLEGGYRGPYPAAPTGALVTQVQYDVFYPGGIVRYNKDGEAQRITVTHIFEWRDLDLAGAWNTVTQTNTNNVLDAQGYTYTINLPYAMRAECRMKRLVSQETDTSKKADTIVWYSLKGLIPAVSKTSFADATTIAVYIRGGDRISSQSEALINVECTRKLPELNGSGAWGPTVATRKISAWLGHVARDIGYTDADINMQRLQTLENIWTARGDTYDQIITDTDTVKGAMIECLGAGFAELTLNRGQITPVRDQLRASDDFDHMYNPQDMSGLLSKDFTSPTLDDFDGVDVEYRDATTWAQETVQCRLPGDAGERVDKVKLEGVTNRDKAYQAGMRRRLAHLYQRWTYSFATELDALNSNYLDLAVLGDTVPGYGQSAFLIAYETSGTGWTILETSEPFDWSAGGLHMIAIRRKDGTASGPYDATYIDEYHVAITGLDFIPDVSGVWEPPFLQFGPEATWCYPALITEVAPNGTKTCKVTAMNYDARIYSYDNTPADN